MHDIPLRVFTKFFLAPLVILVVKLSSGPPTARGIR